MNKVTQIIIASIHMIWSVNFAFCEDVGNLFTKEQTEGAITEARGEPIRGIGVVVSLEPREHLGHYMQKKSEVIKKFPMIENGATIVIGIPPLDENGERDFSVGSIDLNNEEMQEQGQSFGEAGENSDQPISDEMEAKFTEAFAKSLADAGSQFEQLSQMINIQFLPQLPASMPFSRSPTWLFVMSDDSVTALDGIEDPSSFINSKGELISTELLHEKTLPKENLMSVEGEGEE